MAFRELAEPDGERGDLASLSSEFLISSLSLEQLHDVYTAAGTRRCRTHGPLKCGLDVKLAPVALFLNTAAHLADICEFCTAAITQRGCYWKTWAVKQGVKMKFALEVEKGGAHGPWTMGLWHMRSEIATISTSFCSVANENSSSQDAFSDYLMLSHVVVLG